MFKYFVTFIFIVAFSLGAFAQSGAKFSAGVTSVNHDFLQTEDQFTGWNIRLSARLGSRVWFFSPELNYENYSLLPSPGLNPFKKDVRIHTLKIPMGIGWKFKTTPFQKVFVKAGLVGSYVLVIEENDSINFKNIVDLYGGYYGTIGYDFRSFTIDYRYEKSIMDNYFGIEDSKLLFHSLTLGVNF